jgi:uncharacterized protein HemX
MVESFLLRSFGESLLETPGVTEGVERLATSGPLGLALVVVTLCLVWAIRELLKAKDSSKDEAKQNTVEMLKLADRTNEVVNQVDKTLDRTNERLEKVDGALQENTEVLREVNEVMKTLRDQRMRR